MAEAKNYLEKHDVQQEKKKLQKKKEKAGRRQDTLCYQHLAIDSTASSRTRTMNRISAESFDQQYRSSE